MQCLESKIVERETVLGRGFTEFESVAQYQLKCECGKTWTVFEDKFKGRRKVRDCGCGIADEDDLRSALTLAIPLSVVKKLKGHARREELSMSRFVVNLIRDLPNLESEE